MTDLPERVPVVFDLKGRPVHPWCLEQVPAPSFLARWLGWYSYHRHRAARLALEHPSSVTFWEGRRTTCAMCRQRLSEPPVRTYLDSLKRHS